MKVGAFELREPLPELREPIALATLTPWIDINRAGTAALSWLETRFGAKELGKLRRPGNFYDFTRYRPIIYRPEGRREVVIPNTTINYATSAKGKDLLLMHSLEPQMFGEAFVESMLKLLRLLNVKTYVLVGSMYDSVPHTRPLLISGSSGQEAWQKQLRALGVKDSGYEGPTSISTLISQEGANSGMDTATMLVHLPSYVQVDEDSMAQFTLLNLLDQLLGLSLELTECKQRGEEQYARITMALRENPEVAEWVKAMEERYDASMRRGATPPPRLSPEIEKFLRDKGISLG